MEERPEEQVVTERLRQVVETVARGPGVETVGSERPEGMAVVVAAVRVVRSG
jgi:hypothetical protein